MALLNRKRVFSPYSMQVSVDTRGRLMGDGPLVHCARRHCLGQKKKNLKLQRKWVTKYAPKAFKGGRESEWKLETH